MTYPCFIASNCFAKYAMSPAVTHCRFLSQHHHQDLGTNSTLSFAFSLSFAFLKTLNVVTYIVLLCICVLLCCLVTRGLAAVSAKALQQCVSGWILHSALGFRLPLFWSLFWFALPRGPTQHGCMLCFFFSPSIFSFPPPQRNFYCSLPTLFCMSLCMLSEKCTAGLNAPTTLQQTICHLKMRCSVHYAQSLWFLLSLVVSVRTNLPQLWGLSVKCACTAVLWPRGTLS